MNRWPLAECLGTGVAVVGLDSRQTYVNPAFCELLGFSREELLGVSPPFAYWPPEEIGAIHAAFESTVAGSAPAEGFELRFAHKNGNRIDVLLSVQKFEVNGEHVGWVAAVTEITAQARRDRQQRFIIEAGNALAVSLDYETTLSNIARFAVPDFADYCLLDVIAEDGEIKRVGIAHRDPAQVPRLWEMWRRWPVTINDPIGIGHVIRTGEPVLDSEVQSATVRAYTGTNNERAEALLSMNIRSCIIAPMIADGEVVGAITLNSTNDHRRFGPHDLLLAMALADRAALAVRHARLHEAEQRARAASERLQTLTAALSEAVKIVDVQRVIMQDGVKAIGAYAGVIVSVRPETEEVVIEASVGYPERACMGAGRAWPLNAQIPVAEAARTGFPVFVGSAEEWAARYGRYTPTSASAAWAAQPLLSAGQMRGALLWTFAAPQRFSEEERALMQAISRQAVQAIERCELFESERAARTEAEEANQAKTEFLTMMSHELRTPLNAISGYVDLIDAEIHGPVTPEQRHALGRVKRSNHHLLSLINDVLNFAKLQAGHVHLDIQVLGVQTILNDITVLVEPQLRDKELQFTCCSVQDDVRLLADADRLRQIMINLLSNAIKFTADGGSISVDCEVGENTVRLIVQDTGVGIPQDRLGHIFEPFVQLDRKLTTGHEGTGLGLAISRDLARAEGGDIFVTSEVGRGSRFVVSLPRALTG